MLLMKFLKEISYILILISLSFCKSKTEVDPAANLPEPVAQTYTDLAYATSHQAQKLDVYLPAAKAPFPVVIMIHGGGWVMGDKREYATSNKTKALLDRGYAVIAINYRLSGVAKFPAQIQDVKAAVRYVRANAEKYKLNSNKIAAWGTSAGGHLTALLATSAGEKLFDDANLGNANQSSAIQAAVDWFGPTDFLQMDAQSVAQGCGAGGHDLKSSPESALMGFEIQTNKTKVANANPITYVSTSTSPMYITHGMSDCTVPLGQSQILYDAILKIKGPKDVQLNFLTASGHGTGKFENVETVNLMIDFLDTYLKAK
jgi:acetyl esterase/lipase